MWFLQKACFAGCCMISWLWHSPIHVEAESISNMFTQHAASIKLEHQYAGIWQWTQDGSACKVNYQSLISIAIALSSITHPITGTWCQHRSSAESQPLSWARQTSHALSAV